MYAPIPWSLDAHFLFTDRSPCVVFGSVVNPFTALLHFANNHAGRESYTIFNSLAGFMLINKVLNYHTL
jgi:hypothetical protein